MRFDQCDQMWHFFVVLDNFIGVSISMQVLRTRYYQFDEMLSFKFVSLSVWPVKSRRMSIKVAQKWFH